MAPMLDAATIPGTTLAMLTIGPAAVAVLVALVAAVVWLSRATAEEVRRTAAREWERRSRDAQARLTLARAPV